MLSCYLSTGPLESHSYICSPGLNRGFEGSLYAHFYGFSSSFQDSLTDPNSVLWNIKPIGLWLSAHISVTDDMPWRRSSREKQYKYGPHPVHFSPFKGWIPSSFCHFYLFVAYCLRIVIFSILSRVDHY